MFPRTLRLSTWVATRKKLDNLMSHAPPAVKYHSKLFMAKEGLYDSLEVFCLERIEKGL